MVLCRDRTIDSSVVAHIHSWDQTVATDSFFRVVGQCGPGHMPIVTGTRAPACSSHTPLLPFRGTPAGTNALQETQHRTVYARTPTPLCRTHAGAWVCSLLHRGFTRSAPDILHLTAPLRARPP